MIYAFGDCTLDTRLYALHRAGQPQQLRPKAFHILTYLLEHRDRVVPKDELCAQVWPGQCISESTLESTIRAVRQAIGDSGQAQQMLQTLYGHGYRFIAPVTVWDAVTPGEPTSAPPALEQTSAGSLPSASLWAGEQKLVTILCCGVAQAAAQPGPSPLETLHRLLRVLHALAWPEVQRYAGTLLPLTGDCLLAVFGAPVAHEDHAQRAVLAALARQQYHQWIAQVLAEWFPESAETHPELLAHHYTEADLAGQAIPYWQRAGQQALQRSANMEAVAHFTKGLALLATLPETPARARQEIDLQIALGPAVIATRARALCAQIGETPQHFLALQGLWQFYVNCGALPTARELGEQLLQLAQREGARTPRLVAHDALGTTFFILGDYAAARTHCEQAIALIDPAAERTQTLCYGLPPEVRCLAVAALTLWCLGYPTQAVRRSQEALVLAKTLAPPQSLTFAQHWAALLHHHLHEVSAVQAQANALLALATAQEFPLFVGLGTCWQGWALAVQSQDAVGLAQLRQGLAAVLATGQTGAQPHWLVLLAEAAGHTGQSAEGLRLLTKALTAFEATERGDMLVDAYRLQGEFLLRQTTPDTAQAEARFQQALAIARRQQAKSWELRTAMSLSRLWQRQGKRTEAQQLLAEVYEWFTEGFDTADLQEAQALLEAMS